MAAALKQDPELNSPVVHSATRGPDLGMEYAASTNAVQKVLSKLKKSGGFKNKPTDQGAEKESLNALLDDLIEFANKEVIESVWRRMQKQGKFPRGKFMTKKDLIEEHEHLVGALRKGNPTALKQERIKQSKELKEYRSLSSGLNDLTKFELDHGQAKKWAEDIIDLAKKLADHEGEAMKEMSTMLDDLIQFQTDPRPRNNLGEFSGQQEGGPDPNAMYQTYRVAPNTPGMAPNKSNSGKMLAEGGALALVGGAAGAAGGHGYKSLAAWVKKTARARK